MHTTTVRRFLSWDNCVYSRESNHLQELLVTTWSDPVPSIYSFKPNHLIKFFLQVFCRSEGLALTMAQTNARGRVVTAGKVFQGDRAKLPDPRRGKHLKRNKGRFETRKHIEFEVV